MRLRSCPRLLVLALSLPEASHALGLGTMRVESRLNEPLSAQIDILGATPDELKAVRASVASPELFQRYGVERPAFLNSATISVGVDAAGKPVLNLHSSDAFTEPLVEFLIDLRSGTQELVRDYSLLLDPPRAAPPAPAAAAALPNDASELLAELPVPDLSNIVLLPSAPRFAAPSQIVLASDPAGVRAETQYRVVVNDTLRDIAAHAGARSQAEQQRLMIAIFEANRDAFAGNINLLHSGALLRIPSPAEIEVFDSADVEREIRAQMLAWRRGERPAYKAPAAPLVLSQPEPAAARAPAPAPRGTEASAVVSKVNQLEGQMQFLQQSLGEASRQLATASARLGDMERRQAQAAMNTGSTAAVHATPAAAKVSLSATLGALALLLGGLLFACRRLLSRRPVTRKALNAPEATVEVPAIDPEFRSATPDMTDATDGYSVAEAVREPAAPAKAAAGATGVRAGSSDGEATVELTQLTDIDVDTVEERGPEGDGPDTVLLVNLDSNGTDATGTVLDYNLSDLDGHAQHVEMPGTLQDRPMLVERRKNVVDTLMAAIQRDPTRNDLRMKLLETLYSAAATNLRAFKEVARDLARHPERLRADEWQQIMEMGRQLAADDALFADPSAEDKIADCA
jgi:pilus assembly protein FimV